MSLAKLRHQDHYIALTRELREAGYVWREEFGGKHPRIVVSVNGREETVTLSGSPSDCKTTVATKTQIRRRIREWKAEAAPRCEPAAPALFPNLEVTGTMDDSILDICLHQIEGEPRVLDVDLGERLDYGKPERIRDLIKRHRTEFESYAPLAQSAENPGIHGGRPPDVFFLTEEQALLAAALSKTKKAAMVRKMLIRVFVAWHHGHSDAPPVPTYSGDTHALLEMLAELRSEVIRAQQSSAGTAIEHIDGAKAAVLGYLKAFLRDPADKFFEDARFRHRATYDRDCRLIRGMEALERTVGDLIALAGPTISERPFLWSEWYDAARIYAEHFPGRTIPKKGFLSTAIAKGLDSHCKQSRHFHHMEQRVVGGHPRNFWHKDAVWAWLEAGGRDVVEAHVARHTPSAQVISMAAVGIRAP